MKTEIFQATSRRQPDTWGEPPSLYLPIQHPVAMVFADDARIMKHHGLQKYPILPETKSEILFGQESPHKFFCFENSSLS
jgi:hypothetical protein